ncbi:MAG: hypothetical protein BWY85_00096 [Firmicutes bacterium ADurb.Bin506]|nr:MAG: hypothetical protein BWY85_00096 [Firmicutes bacterium ADurb.Bin506]
MAVTAPTRTLTARDFQTIYNALSLHVRRTRPELWTDMFQTNLGQVLIEMLSGVGDWASYGQDAALLETFLSTCRRYESGLEFSNSVGYVPLQAAAAVAPVVASVAASTPLLAYGGTIKAGSRLQGDNGLSYEFTSDLLVPAGVSSIRGSVVQGASFEETFNVPSVPNPVITVANGSVQQDSWHVFVGDPSDPSNEWTQVDSISLQVNATKTYEVEFDANSKLSVRFGDGTYGAIPTQAVTIRYRTCDGAAGNTPVNTIRGTVAVQLSAPATGTAPLDFVNYDPTQAVEGNVGTQTAELAPAIAGGPGSFALVIPLAKVPIKPGALVLTLRFANGGGQIVLQDDSYGNLVVGGTTCTIPDLTNPPSNLLGVLSAYVNYGTGTCSVTLTSDIPVGNGGEQPIADYDYYTKVDPAAALVQGAAVGGANRDDLEQLRTSVKAFIRSQDRLITDSDYVGGLRKVPGVALVKPDARPFAYIGNVVRLNVWTDETITFRSVPYDGASGTAGYRRYAIAAPSIGAAVQQYVKQKSLVTAHHVVQRPSCLWVDLYFRDLIFDPRADAQAVRDGVTQAIVTLFQNSSGFAIRISEIYAAIYAVPGVLYFTLQRAATGTRAQNSPAEAIGLTASGTTFGGFLLSAGSSAGGAIVKPGSLRLSITQGVDRLILADNGLGGWSLVAGASNLLAATGNTVDYVTGQIALTFQSSLSAGETVYATYDNVLADYRQNAKVVKDSLEDGDYWPSPASPQIAPVSTVSRLYDGRPITAAGAASIEYESLKDIVIESALVDLRFYDDTYLYDNSFYYDSELRLNKEMFAINLRTLDFRASPRT